MDPLHLVTHTGAIVIGFIILFFVTVSLMRTVVVPRPLRSNFSDIITLTVIGLTRLVSKSRRSYRGKDGVLAWGGPVLIISMLLGWLLGYLVAYTFLNFGFSGVHSFGTAFREAGSSLFTLGMVGAHSADLTVLDFAAAATGPIVIAMLIGFLPSVYSTYIDRETVIAQVTLTAGEPVWAPEWITRLQMTNAFGNIDEQLEGWAAWATSVRLTHMTYPVLLWVRSPRYTRHFVAMLIAMLDVSALLTALTNEGTSRARFHMLLHGSQALDSLYVLFFAPRPWHSRLPVVGHYLRRSDNSNFDLFTLPAWVPELTAVHRAAARDSAQGMTNARLDSLAAGEARPIQITREEFDAAVELIRESGLKIERDNDTAWVMFTRIRSHYEFPGYEMARQLFAVPAPWTGRRDDPVPTMYPTSALAELKKHPDGN